MRSTIIGGVVTICLMASVCATKTNEIGGVTGENGRTASVEDTDEKRPDELKGTLNDGDLTDDEIWKTDSADNSTHFQSGFICPKSWGGFERKDRIVFKRNGLDVGCNYKDANGSVITLYAYAYSDVGSLEDELSHTMETIIKVRKPVHQEADMLVGRPPPRPKVWIHW